MPSVLSGPLSTARVSDAMDVGQTGHLGGSLRAPSPDCLLGDIPFSGSPGRRMVLLLQIRSQGAEGRRCLFWPHREGGAAQVQTQALWPPTPVPASAPYAEAPKAAVGQHRRIGSPA